MDTNSMAGLRREYGDTPLCRADLPADPVTLLRAWLAEAEMAGAAEPNAMALATCGSDGQPDCRMVLLKGLAADGLRFFSNRSSQKGRQLAANPRAAATFWWTLPRSRQVRLAGTVTRLTDAESAAYFQSRPRQAQLAAAASPQSRVVADRAELERRVAELAATCGDDPVPRPADWGGYCLLPVTWEFWQGRDHRLHDRFRYRAAPAPTPSTPWTLERLAP